MAVNNVETVDIVLMLDKSTSMKITRQNAIKGFNVFVAAQCQQEANVTIEVWQFSEELDCMYSGPIQECPLLDDNFEPKGTTALYDCMYYLIEKTDERLRCTLGNSKESRVQFCVLTDGEDTASHDHNLPELARLVNKFRKIQWEFMYIGFGVDCFHTAKSMGVPEKNIVRVEADMEGYLEGYERLSRTTSEYISQGAKNGTK